MNTMAAFYLMSLGAAALGGLAFGLHNQRDRVIYLLNGRKLQVGLFGDIVSGAIGGFAATMLSNQFFSGKFTISEGDFTTHLGLSVLFGYLGERVLNSMGSRLLNNRVSQIENRQRQIGQKIKKETVNQERLFELAWYRANGMHHEVRTYCDSILEKDPNYHPAKLARAIATAYIGDEEQDPERKKAIYAEVLSEFDQLIDLKFDLPKTLYNKACVLCTLAVLQEDPERSRTLEKAAIALRKSLLKDRFYTNLALKDPDLEPIRDRLNIGQNEQKGGPS